MEILSGSSLLPIELVFVRLNQSKVLDKKVWLAGMKFPTHEAARQRKGFLSSHSPFTHSKYPFLLFTFFSCFCLAFCLEAFSNLMKRL